VTDWLCSYSKRIYNVRIMIILKHILVFVVAGLVCSIGKADNPVMRENEYPFEIDSLMQVIEEKTVEDSLLMDAYRRVGWELRSKNTSKALTYSEIALDYARDISCAECTGTLLANIGHIHWRMGNFSDAFDYLLESQKIAEEIEYAFGFARTLNHLGILYSGQENFEKALEYYFQALREFEEMDSLTHQSMVLNNLGVLYMRQKEYDEAIELHRRSFAISESLHDNIGIGHSLNNLGAVYQEMGELTKALGYFERALSIRKEAGYNRELAATLKDIGYLYFKKGEPGKAMENLQQAKLLYDQVEDKRSMSRVLSRIGEVYAGQNDFGRAEEYFDRSLEISEMLDIPSLSLNIYYHLSKLKADLNDFESAYQYQKDYLELRDSLHDEESRRRVIELQLVYDRERKESEIELLQKSNEIAELSIEKQRLFLKFLIVFIVLILGFAFAFYYRFRVTKRTNRILESQKEEIILSNNRLKEVNNNLIEEKKKVEDLNARLKESEQHLIEVNKTKDKFFSIISHDLRNPFASVVSFSRILKRDIKSLSKDELHELALELDKAVLKINNLLENLLQWSRTQTGKIKYSPEYFEITSVISETVNLFSEAAREKGIEVREKVEACKVFGDINMTQTIIRNLLSNALKYSHPGGEVEIYSGKTDGMLQVSIKDQGVGISPEDQKKLFHIESLFSTYGTYDEKGSGLGLLLCREFTKKQGGEIFLESSLGKGSVFTFTLPLEAPPDA